MNFEAELESILKQVEGSQAAVLMAFDGIVVAEAKKDGIRISYQEAGVEFSRVLKEVSKVSQGNDLGGLREMVVATEKSRFVLHVLNEEYFVLLLLSPEASLGKGRYYVRRAAPGIHREL